MPRRAAAVRVRREELRLRATFAAILVAAGAPASFVSCSQAASSQAADASTGSDLDASAAHDVTSEPDAAGLDDGGADVDCAAIHKLGCAPLIDPDAAYVDDASDAEICPLLLPCGMPQNTAVSGCEVTDVEGGRIGCRVTAEGGCGDDGGYQPTACGEVTLECRCDLFVGGGRRGGALRRRPALGARDPVAAYLRRMAYEEASSVDAFWRLGAELAALGAPRELVDAAARSARDEVRHACAMSRLAARHGGAPSGAAKLARARRPSLETLARENAVEGCVRETYGALLAAWQAAHAQDPALRRVMARVAVDETRHAALAWAIAAWAEGELDRPARARVARARRGALRSLELEVGAPVAPQLVRVVGTPSPRRARALLRGLKALRRPSPLRRPASRAAAC